MLLGCYLSTGGTWQAENSTLNVNHAVPRDFQKRFSQTLIRAVAAQENRDWHTIYRLQWPKTMENISEEQYVKDKSQEASRLSRFTVLRIINETLVRGKIANGSWSILGCASIVANGRVTDSESEIKVFLVDGRWYSGTVGVLVPVDETSRTSPCSHDHGVPFNRLFDQ